MATASFTFEVKENASISFTFRDGKVEVSIHDKTDHGKAAAGVGKVVVSIHDKSEHDKAAAGVGKFEVSIHDKSDHDKAVARKSRLVTVGPCGGIGGEMFDMDVRVRSPRWVLTTVRICHGWCIDSIQVVHRHNDGREIESPRWVGGGGTLDEIRLDDKEHLVAIFGYYGTYKDRVVIKSLSFVTNLWRIYGPYGTHMGSANLFHLTADPGKVIGFHGRHGLYLVAIGIKSTAVIDSSYKIPEYINNVIWEDRIKKLSLEDAETDYY